MELIYYIYGLFNDVPSIPDHCITTRLDTAFKGNASIWYTEMNEIHGRRKSPWWKRQINQKYSNDVRKTTNIGKYTPYKSSGFKEKQPFKVEFKGKPIKRAAEVANKKNYCHSCDSTDHYNNGFPNANKKVYAIQKVPEEQYQTGDSDSDSMGDSIREKSDEEKDPREELLVEYQEESPLEIQNIQFEAGMPEDTANKNLCKHT
ncbi:hypothetical protein O181_086028 [Austropuccinia psidii MF-1]|uniref:Uncharacterized protein n=1 Tax=Austropuccinia psidii MF-1 TaxID=1389203 RepID=A0A9Q3FYL3_9BASI|nr:hypothetical protein [Austropuccinia psidii MF-1]